MRSAKAVVSEKLARIVPAATMSTAQRKPAYTTTSLKRWSVATKALPGVLSVLPHFDHLGSYETNYIQSPQLFLKSVLFMSMISIIPVSLVTFATDKELQILTMVFDSIPKPSTQPAALEWANNRPAADRRELCQRRLVA